MFVTNKKDRPPFSQVSVTFAIELCSYGSLLRRSLEYLRYKDEKRKG